MREPNCRFQCVLCSRSTAEVAASLLRRDEITGLESCNIWFSNVHEADFHTRDDPRILASYEFLSDCRGVVSDIASSFDLVRSVTYAEAGGDIDDFLGPTLRHFNPRDGLAPHPKCRLTKEWRDLRVATGE